MPRALGRDDGIHAHELEFGDCVTHGSLGRSIHVKSRVMARRSVELANNCPAAFGLDSPHCGVGTRFCITHTKCGK